jgi:hypothetical protein
LEGLPAAGGGGGDARLAGAAFGVDAEVAQVGEQLQKDAEGIVEGVAAGEEEDGGVEGADVAVVDIAGEAFEEEIGIAAFEGAGGGGGREGMAGAEVFAQEQGLDLAGVAADANGSRGKGRIWDWA